MAPSYGNKIETANNNNNNIINNNNNVANAPHKKMSLMPQDFEFMKIIGKGSVGKVYLAKHTLENKVYAIKVISKQMILKLNEKRHIMSERNILLQNLRHPFLVGLHYSFQSRDKLYFVLDYANGGDMFYHLNREKMFDENRARFYAAEITSALGYLHKEGIVYRDLKPENILLDSCGHLMLTDFGLCKEGLYDQLDTCTTFCGTAEYLAPEVLRQEPYDRCVDWWCLGGVLYEMLFGLPPFFSRDRSVMFDNILHQPLRFRSNASPEARHILEGLLSKNKCNRLGFIGDADDVKQHEFFRQIHWPSLEAKKIRPPYHPKVTDQMDVQNIDPIFIEEQITSSVWKQHQLTVNSSSMARGVNNGAGLNGTNSYGDSFRGFSYAPPMSCSMQQQQLGGGGGGGVVINQRDQMSSAGSNSFCNSNHLSPYSQEDDEDEEGEDSGSGS